MIAPSTEDRNADLGCGEIAALPATLWGRAEAQYHSGSLNHLEQAMAAALGSTRQPMEPDSVAAGPMTLSVAAFAPRC